MTDPRNEPGQERGLFQDTPFKLASSAKPQKAQTGADSSQFQTANFLLAPETVIAGRYRVIEQLGRGGMGIVYKVEQIFLKDIFALKVLHNTNDIAVGRFQKEAQAAHRLDHPNLVKVHDFGVLDNDFPFLVMDYAEGTPLSERLRNSGPLSPAQAIPVFIQMCDALIYAHDKGIIHRDLKPSNVILSSCTDGTYQVRIVDFGIAKMMFGDDGQNLTRTGEAVGSPLYMSPEQCQGQPVDNRSDIYSFACTLFETLTGVTPFAGDNALSTMMLHQSETPPSLKEVCLGKHFAAPLEQMIAKMLAKDPFERHQSMAAVKNDLLQIKAGKALQPEVQIRPSSTLKLKPILVGVCILGALCLAVLAPAVLNHNKHIDISTTRLGSEAINTMMQVVLPNRSQSVKPKAAPGTEGDGVTSKTVTPAEEFAPVPIKESKGPWILIFPKDQAMGDLWPAGANEEQQKQFGKIAKGTIRFPLAHPLHITPSYPLVMQPQNFRRFRPDEVTDISMRYNLNTTNETLKYLDHFTSLKLLDLEGTAISDAGLDYLKDLPNLLWISVADCEGVTGRGVSKLKSLPKMWGVKANECTDAGALVTALEGNTEMRDVSLRSADLKDEDLLKFKNIPNLSALQIGGNKDVTDKGVANLAGCDNLRYLNIEKLKLTPACIDSLRKLPKLRDLKISNQNWTYEQKLKLREAVPHSMVNEHPPLKPDPPTPKTPARNMLPF